MGDATFRPQDGVIGYGWPTAADALVSEWIKAATFDRFPSVAENIGMTAAIGRADRSSSIGGLTGQIAGSRTVLTPQGTFEVPFALNTFCLGLIAQHAGALRTEVQIAGDSAWTQVISPDETDIDLLTRFPTFIVDMKDGEPKIWFPTGIQSIVWNFTKGDVAKLVITPVSLGFSFYDLAVQEAGTPARGAVFRGWLNATNNALASRKLFTKVTAFADPLATVLAGFAVTPTGTTSFPVTAGLNAEGRPNWTKIIDGDSALPGLPVGTADVKMEMAFLDTTDVTTLDEESQINPSASPTKITPSQPEMTVSAICLTVDGTIVADLEGLTLTTVNDLAFVEGGACGAFPQAFKRTGVSTAVAEWVRSWLTFRHQKDIHDDAAVAILIEGESDVQIDSGGVQSDRFNFSMSIPVGRISDGQEFKSLSAGATDDTETISVMGEPTGSTPQWELTCQTDVENIVP